MGYKKKDFIAEAYSLLGYSDYAFDLEPEQLESARRKLDSMMATWNSKGIRIKYPLADSPASGDLDDDTDVPDFANEAITYNLAVRLGPTIGKAADMDVKAIAFTTYKALLNSTTNLIEVSSPHGTIRGAGNRSDNPFTQPIDNNRIDVGDDTPLEL